MREKQKMSYIAIYDGNCNLCVSLVQLLENLDKGDCFEYIPMQDTDSLAQWNVTPEDCEGGMILIDRDRPSRRWQGSDAAEEIGNLLPAGNLFVSAYRSLPGMKWTGDRLYEQIRDNRYQLFGKRSQIYRSTYPATCSTCENSHAAL